MKQISKCAVLLFVFTVMGLQEPLSAAEQQGYRLKIAVLNAEELKVRGSEKSQSSNLLYEIGIGELLTQDLRKVPGFLVIDRKTVVEKYQKNPFRAQWGKAASQLGVELGVDLLVRVSFKIIGNKHIEMSLTSYDVSEGKAINIKNLKGPKKKIFKILDDFTIALAKAYSHPLSKKNISRIRKHSSVSLNAFMRFSKGMQLYYLGTLNSFILAQKQLGKAEFYDILFLPSYVAKAQIFYERSRDEVKKRKKLLDKAHEGCRKALFLDSDYIEAYELLGQIYLARGNYADAIREGNRAIRLNPLTIKGRVVLVKSYLAMGKRAEARREADNLFEIDPLNYEVRDLIDSLDQRKEG